MKFRIGYEITYDFPQPTPTILMLNIHYSRVSDLIEPDHIHISPSIPITAYRDSFGNWCSRVLAPAGRVRFFTNALIRDNGLPDAHDLEAAQHPVESLPDDALVFLLGSRYCDPEPLAAQAWALFGGYPTGGRKVQAVCDFVHRHIRFGYEHARHTKTASEAFAEGRGVCRDYAHLAVALCRSLNIPARYCTGHLSDAGEAPPYAPGDFAAWFEAYLGGQWRTYDPRNNTPRIGRFLIGRGRDAADVAISTTFGPNQLVDFRVWADEVASPTG